MSRSFRRGPRAALCLLVVSSACEPLDIPLFPHRIDAGFTRDADPDASSGPGPAPSPAEAGPPAPCLPGARSCEACVSAGACPDELRCHPVSGECVPPCSSLQTTCPGASSCNAELGVCVECIEDDDCAQDGLNFCDRRSSRCVECLTNDECSEEGPVCLPQGICGCNTDDDCSEGSCEQGECEDE